MRDSLRNSNHLPPLIISYSFRRTRCYRLPTVPDSIVDNITAKYLRGSIFLPSLGTFPNITCFDMHALSPCIVYTANAFLYNMWHLGAEWSVHAYIQTEDLKAAFSGIRECSRGSTMLTFLPSHFFLVLVLTSFANHTSPRGYLSHFRHIPQPMELFTHFGWWQ